MKSFLFLDGELFNYELFIKWIDKIDKKE